MKKRETRCCIVGGGPAGMVLGWLLARAGVDVVVLEKHGDFLRDFRGDTIHPSTLELVHELGALDRFLARPHTEIDHLDLVFLGETVPGPDFRHVSTHVKKMVLMPQWDFLDFVKAEAEQYPGFHLKMNARAEELIFDGDRVAGVRGPDLEVRADLVVAADGRHSVLRDRAELPRTDLGAPIDVLWLRVPRAPGDPAQVLGRFERDRFLVMLDRGDYWQCAYLIEKGGFPALQARGLPAFRDDLAVLAPFLGDRTSTIAGWDDVKLLTVVIDRLDEWARPGLLCIGDAAHAMSPIGGVGINLAIQDAIAAANLLGEILATRAPTLDELAAVQARRAKPARRIQRLQVFMQDHVLARVLAGKGDRVLRMARWTLKHAPGVRARMAELLGVGQLEHLTLGATDSARR